MPATAYQLSGMQLWGRFPMKRTQGPRLNSQATNKTATSQQSAETAATTAQQDITTEYTETAATTGQQDITTEYTETAATTGQQDITTEYTDAAAQRDRLHNLTSWKV